MKLTSTKILLASLVLMFASVKASAFTPFKSKTTPFSLHTTPTTPAVPNATAPFDGGLSLLVVAGVGYATKKAYNKRKNSKA